jgi:hypothetical protein
LNGALFGTDSKTSGKSGKGGKPAGTGHKPAPAKPKSTPVQNNETSRSGVIFLQKHLLTNKERGKALAAGGSKAAWHPSVGSAYVVGTYTPKGVKPLRPAAVPPRAGSTETRPAGKTSTGKPYHIPSISSSSFPRETPSPAKTLSMGLSYGLGKGNFDAGYFTDAADLK